MTACTNKGGKAGRVITAALVATLSVGAPVVALATTADAATGDIELMAADEHEAFLKGTVAEYKVGEKTVEGNEAVTIKKDDLANSKIVITKVTPDAEGAKAIDVPDTGATHYYKKVAKGTASAAEINGNWYTYVCAETDFDASKFIAGEYLAATTYAAGDSFVGKGNVAPAVSFTVTADSLEGAKLMKNVAGEDEDPEYTDEITWEDGQKWTDLVVVLGDKPVATADATVEVYEKNTGGSDLYDDTKVTTQEIMPGTYEVVIKATADGDYGNSDPARYDLTVSKLDLSKLDLSIEDVTNDALPGVAAIEGDGVAKIQSYLTGANADKGLVAKMTDKTWWTAGAGEYAATLSVKDGSELAKRATGTATIKYYRLAADAANVTWTYDGKDISFLNGQTVTIDPSQKDNLAGFVLSTIDPSKFAGTYKVDGEDTKLELGQFSVKVTDADGNEVTDLTSLKKGTYTLKVEAVPSALEYKVKRSTFTIKVNYQQGTVADTGTTFTYDGKVVNDTITNLTYDGTDKLDKLGVQVKSGDKTLVEGTDYTVKVTKKDANDKDVEVTEAVDAGEYTVTVSSDTYKIAGNSDKEILTFTVAKFVMTADNTKVEFPTAITYSTVEYNEDKKEYETVKKTFIPYTGEDITPVVKVALTKDADGNNVWTELDASNYELSFTLNSEKADSVKELGKYTVTVSATDGNVNFAGTNNFTEFENESEFEVANKKVFIDVDSSAWYAQSVYTAVEQNYIKGMNNSNVFAPDASISRADVVVVLYRMAGGITVGNDDSVNQDLTYLTKFSDVQGNEYFANALAWASKAGVVTGYEDGTFGPSDPVTVEQFATMLARYAKLVGTDTSVEDVDAVLGEVADGAQVSDFARDAVAWAVDGGYLAQGSDIVPQSEVSRGRMITIAVRYQPKQLEVIA